MTGPHYNRSHYKFIPGANVTIDVDPSTGEDVQEVTISATSTAAGVDVEDDATPVATATTIDFGDNLTVTDDGGGHVTVDAAAGVDLTAIDFLVGTTTGSLSAEIVVGTSPGGELGGTWGTPTVDATHSGSSHAATQAAAEATAAAALSAHDTDTTSVHGIADTTVLATDTEVATAVSDHAALADPHTGYRLESADHTHATTGLQGGTVSHDVLTDVSANDHHAQSHGNGDHTSTFITATGVTYENLDANGDVGTSAGQVAIGNHSHPGGSAHTIAEAGTPVTDRGTLNFLAGFDLTDDAGNDETEVAIDLTEVTTFTDHSARHENGGADEISLAGLDGTPTDLQTHLDDTADAHDASAISIADAGNDFTATTVEGALDELQADNEAHVAAADPHTGYVLESLFDAKGDLIAASADNTPAKLTAGTNGQMLTAQSGQSTGLQWATVFFCPAWSKEGNLSTGTGTVRWYNDTGRTLTFVSARASVGTAPATQSIIIDVNVGGTTIMTGTKVVIAASANTGEQTTFSTTTIADDAYLTVDIDQVGTGTVGADLAVQVWMSG